MKVLSFAAAGALIAGFILMNVLIKKAQSPEATLEEVQLLGRLFAVAMYTGFGLAILRVALMIRQRILKRKNQNPPMDEKNIP